MTVADEKRQLRRRLREARQATAGIIEPRCFAGLAAWSEAKTLVTFANAGDEPAVVSLLLDAWNRGVTCLATRVADEELELVSVEPTTRWRLGRLRVPEPVGEPCEIRAEGVFVLVPGVAFTADGRRLGRGGGYYDRLIASLPGAFFCGVCGDDRLLDDLPTEPHDRRVDAIVTPDRTILA
ncbi:MAG: 5-formyltetrahydrofolate cyclo-ligase [Planctomycetota bacterium]